MIHIVASFFKSSMPWLNVFHYISFRAMASFLTAITCSLLWGDWFINRFQSFLKSGVRPWTPDSHKVKGSKPTMGGLFMVAVVVIATLLWSNLFDAWTWLALLCLIEFGLIGALDDWKKITTGHGISAKLKSRLQLLAGSLLLFVWWYSGLVSTTVHIPIFKSLVIDLSLFYYVWALFIIIGTSNAVNLTDGLDGLAIGVLIPNFMTFSLICYAAGHAIIATYLHIPFVGTGELAVVGGALCGASLGFLWYNAYPAQIFMGDVGALSLGALLGFTALASKQECLLAIAGGLFVVETASVVIQVFYFKWTGKRLFKMAPIHHHFELLGWSEAKITMRFCIIACVLCLIALMMLKIR